jgi:hypothetical protein
MAQRGGIVADVSGLLTSQQNGNGGTPNAVVDLVVRIPIAEHTFVDADLPLGFGALGNPMVGVHHVFRPADRLWLTLGGAFGFPLINNAGLEAFAAANAFWDAERFMAYKMPFAIRLGLEGHAGLFEFRVQGDPVWGLSIASCPPPGPFGGGGCNDSRDVHFAAFQHAFEVQVGHEIGGGVRYQGVATGTNTPSIVGVDSTNFGGSGPQRYQGSLEPFFRLYRDPVFFRLGLLMPLNNPLGAPFDHTWGVRATVGYSLD